MVDALKIGVKVALIAGITAGILLIFANLQIPTLEYNNFSQALGAGLAVIYHWVPVSVVIVPFIVAILGIRVAILGFELGMIAVRWVMKVNE